MADNRFHWRLLSAIPLLAVIILAALEACLSQPSKESPAKLRPTQMLLAERTAPVRPPNGPMSYSTGILPGPASMEEDRLCRSLLWGSRIVFHELAPRRDAPSCGYGNGVALVSLSGDHGPILVTGLGAVTCDAALNLQGWARYSVDRAARSILGSGLSRIETRGSYICRSVAGSTRPSAHAKGQAIDVSAFILADGRRLTVARGWNGGDEAVRRFFRVVTASACKRFAVVLSPNYNEAHQDHLHVEGRLLSGQDTICR